MPHHIHDLSNSESVAIFRALASESRARIMEMLGERDMNINELSVSLGLAQPSITKHIQILEEAGLVVSDYLSGAQGMQKRCRKVHDRLIVDLSGKAKTKDYIIEIEVPVGMYTRAEVVPTCGLATRDRMVGVIDDPLAFAFPDRAKAEILWSGGGFIEYKFPNSLPVTSIIESIELVGEVASEAPGYANDMNQHGFLKAWRINETGTYVDGEKLSDITVADLDVHPWQATRVRLGIKSDAENQGGFTIFGKGFGSFEQDLILRIHHSTKGGDLPENVKKGK